MSNLARKLHLSHLFLSPDDSLHCWVMSREEATRIDNDKQMKRMQATISSSWATYRRMRKDGVIGDVPLKLTPMRKEDQLVKYGDENGLIFAPICKPSNDGADKCFDSCKTKLCTHKTDNIPLNDVGQYVMFPSRWWHRGYNEIRSEKVYYTAQLFCIAAQDPDSWSNQTRKQNRNMKIGRIPQTQMDDVSRDITQNWDVTYSETKFPPSKAFDGEIDRRTNRHLQGTTFREIPYMYGLVQNFERRFEHLCVNSVWLIKKTRNNGGFQGWHRDFYLKTDIIATIVVNVGVCEVR